MCPNSATIAKIALPINTSIDCDSACDHCHYSTPGKPLQISFARREDRTGRSNGGPYVIRLQEGGDFTLCESARVWQREKTRRGVGGFKRISAVKASSNQAPLARFPFPSAPSLLLSESESEAALGHGNAPGEIHVLSQA